MQNTFADTLTDVTQKAPKDFLLNPQGVNLLQKTSQHPEPCSHPNVTRIELPYLDFSVNVWLCQTPKHQILIDTGGPNSTLLQQIPPQTSRPLYYLLTHEHPDHIGGLEDLRANYPSLTLYPHVDFVTIQTPGHCEKHVSYYHPSLEICFCGDALFAGSMGRANFDYAESILSLHRLLDLPEQTILFPGHGPASTVKWEKEFNCFYTV